MPEQTIHSISEPLVEPLCASAVYRIADLDALDRIMSGTESGFVYARDGHPNARSLAAELASLEHARWGLVCASGMAALAAAFLGSVASGDRVIASDQLYGRTTSLLRSELRRFGVEVEFVNVHDLGAVRAAFARPARLLFVETMSNPLCRVPDLPALVELAHRNRALVLVDNTFATPILCRPLDLGADLVMESLTKMIGGHSDLVLGFLGGSDAGLASRLEQIVSTWGFSASPFDCWLCQRGLATLDLRVRAAAANAARLADWLSAQPPVSRVIYPGRSDHPDHEQARRLLTGGFGTIVCFELVGGRDAVNRFIRQTDGIPFAPSLGHATTTCSYPRGTSHRFEPVAEQQRQGITEGLIRLSVGVEVGDQIQAALARGLALASTGL